ncbi:MAG: T9SS type A sorting domain-containing protein [Bacteroidales bacterium]|nr:T9SS type A sorting domain-containing protein [Bacteroidales bacterium]
MKAQLYLIIFGLVFFCIKVDSQDLLWKAHYGGIGETYPYKTIVDDQNNIYTFGIFKNTVIFGGTTITSTNGTYDFFLNKTDNEGNVVWTKHTSNNGISIVGGICFSLDYSKVIISGAFQSTLDLIDTTISSTGGNDAFIAIYSTNTGDLIQANLIGAGLNLASSNQTIRDIIVNENDSILISGIFRDTIIFGDITKNIGLPGLNGYVAKCDIYGNVDWAKAYKSSIAGPVFYSIEEANNGYYLAGYFNGIMNLDAGNLTSSNYDMLLYKMNKAGVGIWVRQIGGPSDDYGYSTTSDELDNVYINGYFTSSSLRIDSTKTDTSKLVIEYQGSNDLIFVKYNDEGTLQWANHFGSTGDDRLYNSSYKNGNLFIAGQLGGSVTFRGENISPKGGIDALGLVFDSYDNLVYLFHPGGTLDDVAVGCAIDSSGNFILNGHYKSSKIYFKNGDSLMNDNTSEKDMFIAKYNKMSISMVSTQPSCYGGSNGSISVTPEGIGEEPYTYQWSHGPTTQNVSGLVAGWYKVTVTDNTGYVVVDSIQVGQPTQFVVTLDSTSDVKCFGNTNGKIYITPTGGTPSYYYSWSSPDGSGLKATQQDQTTLTQGTYTVIVRDYNFCYDTVSDISINEPTPIVITGIVDTVSAEGAGDGSIDITVTGGTPAYSYLWSNDSITEDIDDLDGGTYNVTVTDANGCTEDTSFFVYEPNALLIDYYNITDIHCFGETDGAIDITVSGGIPGYTYVWKQQGHTDTLSTDQDISNLSEGNYYVTIIDNNGIGTTIISPMYTITEPDLLGLALFPEQISCYNKNDGVIDAYATGGTPPYTHHWIDDYDPAFNKYTEDISNLKQGYYRDTCRDANGCLTTGSSQILNPPAISVSVDKQDISCHTGQHDGSICLTPSGGYSPYTYLWNNGKTTSCITLLSAGSYSCVLKDSKNCPLNVGPYTIIRPAAISLTNQLINPVSCYGLSDGWTAVYPTGGTGKVTIDWTGPVNGTGDTLYNMPFGTYYLVGTDTNNCTGEGQVIMTQPPILELNVDNQQNIACMGDSTGVIEVSATGGTGVFTYEWSTIDGGGIVPGNSSQNTLAAGSYKISVFDANLCEDSTSSPIILSEPSTKVSAAEELASHQDALCNGSSDGTLKILASNGTPPYEYSLNRSDWTTDSNFTGLGANTYVLWVRDATPCYSDAAEAVITEPEAIQISTPIIIHESASGANDGQITIIANGGTGELIYTLRLGETILNQVDSIFTSLAPGGYMLSIRDFNECNASLTDTLKVNAYVNVDDLISSWQINVFPNPTKNKTYIRLIGYERPSLQVDIINLNGQKVYNAVFNKINSDSLLEIDLSDKPKGVYILYLNNKNSGIQIILE